MNTDLPRNMEARPLSKGRTSYRVKMPSGSKVNLGWNLEEALELYRNLYLAPDEIGMDNMAAEIYNRQKKGAKQRGIGFELTVDAIKRLLASQKLRCAITGRRFSLETVPGVRARPYAPSLDRIRNGEPYAEGNCRVVCAAINTALSDLGAERFMELLEPLIQRRVQQEISRLFDGNDQRATRAITSAKSGE